MKALEQNSSGDFTFVIDDSERSLLSDSVQQRTKRRILEHVKNGIDIILVTSAKHTSEPISLEKYFSNNDNEIRTIALNSHTFGTQAGNANIDLSMISAVVYESIHLDTHFAIIIDNADQFPLESLNQLIKLALGINTSKNNVNFIFSGGPNLLGTIDQVSDVRRLSLAHYSLDKLTEEDIKEFIDIKQNDVEATQKLQFNKYALKKICTLANGSLANASKLLEWCRLFSKQCGNNKVTVGFIDNLIAKVDDTNILSNYPQHDYQFASDTTTQTDEAHDDANVEFKKQDELLNPPANNKLVDEQSVTTTKTVYIESDDIAENKTITAANVYEKVMDDSIESSPQTSKLAKSSLKEKGTTTAKAGNESGEQNYTDTYLIDALEHINDPLPYAPEDLPLSSPNNSDHILIPKEVHEKHTNRGLVYTLVIIAMLCSAYFVWSNQLIDPSTLKSILPNTTIFNKNNLQDQNEGDVILPKSSSDDESVQEPAKPEKFEENKHTIEALVELAYSQIEAKKLTTPAGDNAFETFKLILDFQPNNKKALEGIEKIKNRYRTWAKLDINDGKIKRAKYFLSRAIEISPDDKEAHKLLSSLEYTAH